VSVGEAKAPDAPQPQPEKKRKESAP
jgi:hypothetical protein